MGIIRRLPETVVNQIAAGEVVERPASVVKELLENAIDAQATRIDLSVERGGKDLVRVADNGTGMAPDDLVPAFQPHATSKLAVADELHKVRTLGFRGEALAAIAEIAKIRCQTREPEAAQGCELAIEGGVFGPVKKCGCPTGTVIEVRNLFHNIPVRRKFLKSDLTEGGHVVEMFQRIALAHPRVHFTYRSGGRVIHDLPATTGTHERIATFFGRELAESLLWVEGQFDDMHLWGYVAHPSQSRSTAKGQFLFLGGRYVRDRSLSHALNEAYRGLLMTGRMPVAFLHLEISPEDVDFNVHPTKIEVRFRDSQRVYSQLLSTLRQTFLKSDLHSRLQAAQAQESTGGPASELPSRSSELIGGVLFPDEIAIGAGRGQFELTGAPSDRQTVASWFQPAGVKPQVPESVGQPKPPVWAQSLPLGYSTGPGGAFDEFAGTGSGASPRSTRDSPAAEVSRFARDESAHDHARTVDPPSALRPPAPDLGQADNGASASGGTIERAAIAPRIGGLDEIERHREGRSPPVKAIQVHESYLIAETGDGMVVIDQHALHERILFEELKTRVTAGQVESQRLLVPEPVDLGSTEVPLVLEHAELLAQLGLEVEGFGGDTVVVRSIPAMLRNVVPERLVRDLAEHLRTQPLPPTREGLLGELLHMIACKAAVKAGQPLTPQEIDALLERRHLVADSHHCPHGRPTALVFTKADLEKQFGRT
jgi:DNA mismatch repair protein MutL